jgi:hypothetical protein
LRKTLEDSVSSRQALRALILAESFCKKYFEFNLRLGVSSFMLFSP